MRDVIDLNDGDEYHDAGDGDSAFEERVRTLFEGEVAARGVSAPSVIAGARRRRMRRRATAAGSSVAVLGVAAGVVAFGMHPAGNLTLAAGTTTATTPAPAAPSTTPPTTESTSAPAQKCSPSVKGAVPEPMRVTADGLVLQTISGTTGGIPWSAQIHPFSTWQSWSEWRKTQVNPPEPSGSSTVLAPPVLVRMAGRPDFTMSPVLGHTVGFSGSLIGGGVDGSPKAYLVEMWAVPTVDHLCLQFAHRAEFEPVFQIHGGVFAMFGYTTADLPQRVIGYDAAGRAAATGDGKEGLLPLPSYGK